MGIKQGEGVRGCELFCLRFWCRHLFKVYKFLGNRKRVDRREEGRRRQDDGAPGPCHRKKRVMLVCFVRPFCVSVCVF